jgi:hypothetical protein
MQSIGLSNKVSDMEVYKFDSLKTVGAEYAKDDPRFKALSDEEILANDGPAEQIALELNAGTYFTTLGVKDGGTGEVTPVDTASIAVTSSSTNSIGDNTNPYGIIAAERVFSSKISRDRLSAVVEKNKNGENITGDIVQFSSETGLSTDVIKQIIGVK